MNIDIFSLRWTPCYFVGALVLCVGCELYDHEPTDDAAASPESPSLRGCSEPSDWVGNSCDAICGSNQGNYPSRCVENGCVSVVQGYRLWDACWYDEPPEQSFPLDLGGSDILDASLQADYFYISCCCEEYDSTDSGTESESG